VFNWFKRKKQNFSSAHLVTDIHSHLLPGLDDGVGSFEESEEVIMSFIALGYKKLITTPHVMSDHYRNTSDMILSRLEELKEYLREKKVDVIVEAAAEYYLDESLVRTIENNVPLLTFGKKYLLFETNFITEPLNLKEFIFLATTKGYKLILAHPERYLYLLDNLSKAEDLLNRGVLFQVNVSSIAGQYSKAVQVMAQKLIDRGWIHLLGSDCHNLQHVKLLERIQNTKYFQKALSLPLLNNTL
jgi:tyrosine-protein phosphatase YwqE